MNFTTVWEANVAAGCAGRTRRLGVLYIDYDDAVPAVVTPPAGAGFEVARYRTRYPVLPRTPHDRLLTALGYVDAAERAAADGCDALLLDVFPDYGINEMRGAVPIPVVGAGEAGIAAAATGGRSFSIVTVWPESMGFLYTERLAFAPGGDRCAGVHHVFAEIELARLGTEHSMVARMDRGESRIVDYLVESCRMAVERDGSDAVLLGCTCMVRIGPTLQERCDFPVIEASRAGMVAACGRLAAGGPMPELALSPRRGTVPLILDAWLEHGEVPQLSLSEQCEVCVSLEL